MLSILSDELLSLYSYVKKVNTGESKTRSWDNIKLTRELTFFGLFTFPMLYPILFIV